MDKKAAPGGNSPQPGTISGAAIPVPKAVEKIPEEAKAKENTPDELDPLDQFLKKKKDPSELHVKDIGNFVADFDHLEDQLDDAHRAEVMKAKMAAIHKMDSAQPQQGGDKLSQLDALLDSEFEKATQLAQKEKDAQTSKSRDAEAQKSKEQLDKLEKYQKYLEMPATPPSTASGGNELIRYLESKVNQQAIEIENLKKQKQELVQEVFSDALNDEHKDTDKQLERSKKEIERLENEIKLINSKKSVLEEKLMTKSSQIEQLLTDKASGGNKIEEAKKIVAQQYEVKIQQLMAQIQQKSAVESENQTELKKSKDQVARQTEMITELRKSLSDGKTAQENLEARILSLTNDLKTSMEASSESAPPDEIEKFKNQIKALQDRVKKTMTTGSAQLKSLANYYEIILNSIKESVIVFDRNNHVLFVNKEARTLLAYDAEAIINCNLSEIKPLAPLVTAAKDAATNNKAITGEGTIVSFPNLQNADFQPDFYPIAFPGRDAILLILTKLTSPRAATESKEITIEALCTIKEQLFSLKILADIIFSKRDRPEVVEEISQELKKELGNLLDSL
jgi:PAS domain-containing protein